MLVEDGVAIHHGNEHWHVGFPALHRGTTGQFHQHAGGHGELIFAVTFGAVSSYADHPRMQHEIGQIASGAVRSICVEVCGVAKDRRAWAGGRKFVARWPAFDQHGQQHGEQGSARRPPKVRQSCRHQRLVAGRLGGRHSRSRHGGLHRSHRRGAGRLSDGLRSREHGGVPRHRRGR